MQAEPLRDPQIHLHRPPQGDLEAEVPEVSIVIPALNEELTIGDFIDWCHEGLRSAGVRGEILIVDSSTDRTAEIALSKGARVLKAPKRGLGRAYIDALPYARGKYLILGDCDCTYDFRELAPFIEALRGGYEFVMGSRFKGRIDPGAMPALHRYFGTPLTTWILNFIHGSSFTDIHCGMRAMTREALQRIDLQSQSWEYASEMVLRAVRLKLKATEVPIHFLKDREGRLSHHRRSGWFSPWQAGWINLKAMFVHGADFFLVRPGWVLLGMGLLLTLPMTFGPVTVGGLTFSLYWMLLGVMLSVVGLQAVMTGILVRTIYDSSRERTLRRWLRVFSYNRTVWGAVAGFLAGMAMTFPLVLQYVAQGYALSGVGIESHLAVTGILFMIVSFMVFTFTLVLHATAISLRVKDV